jgi:hypothetical protein
VESFDKDFVADIAFLGIDDDRMLTGSTLRARGLFSTSLVSISLGRDNVDQFSIGSSTQPLSNVVWLPAISGYSAT